MDYQTAHNLLVAQGIDAEIDHNALISRLKQGSSPVPGQVTSILLALKVVFEALKTATHLDRELACSLYLIARESRQHFETGQHSGVEWPPLLNEDLNRIDAAVKSIFTGIWHDT